MILTMGLGLLGCVPAVILRFGLKKRLRREKNLPIVIVIVVAWIALLIFMGIAPQGVGGIGAVTAIASYYLLKDSSLEEPIKPFHTPDGEEADGGSGGVLNLWR